MSAEVLGAAAIRAVRGAKAKVDPFARPLVVVERERLGDGSVAPSVVVFAIGRECPYTCVFCDLWRHTLDTVTPPRALVAQLEAAGADGWPAGVVLKLYNASSFFDPLAVPPEDLAALAQLCGGARRVVVESHPRFLRRHPRQWLAFAEAIAPATLEVAIGLETADPLLHRRLGKGTSVNEIEEAAAALMAAGVAWRAFVLVGTPYLEQTRHVDDAVATAAWAVDHGAAHVALIPVRGGNGAMEILREQGLWSPPRLDSLERSFAAAQDVAQGVAQKGAVVTLDLWDLELFCDCASCFGARRERLQTGNLSGHLPAAVRCADCGRG